jgi:MFS family permease
MPIVPPAEQEPQVVPSPAGVYPRARMALVLLLLINLFNYIDRYVLVAVQPKIGADLFEPDDPDKKTKLGALTTVFLIVYFATAPMLGWLADRVSRWLVVGVGVILWSLASGATGLATVFWFMLATRCLVGIGEAAYGPAAPTLLADYYPMRKRARVFAWFYLAMPVGVALGFLLGAYVEDIGLRWRDAFLIVVPPGLALGLWCFWMRELPRHHRERAHFRDYLHLLRIPSFVLCTLGMTALLFGLGGIGNWMNTYLFERAPQFEWTYDTFKKLQNDESWDTIPNAIRDRLDHLPKRTYPTREVFNQKVKELINPSLQGQLTKKVLHTIGEPAQTPSLAHIDHMMGIMLFAAAIPATLLGSWIGDKLRKRLRGAYFIVSGVALLLALPCFFLILVTPLPTSWVFVYLTTFCLTLPVGPANTILANVTHPSVRATAFALNLFIIHALGDAISPVILGRIADLSGGKFDLGFMLVAGMVGVGGLLWIGGARYLERDTERAADPIPGKLIQAGDAKTKDGFAGQAIDSSTPKP